MDLINKIERDNFGLTSWERAIVWSALSLRASNVRYNNDNPDLNYSYTNAVRIALARAVVDEALTATLRIEANLPYSPSDGIASGGRFIEWLQGMYQGTARTVTGDSCGVLSTNGVSVTNGGDGLPVEPSYVTSLEQYFLWCCWEVEERALP